MSAILAILLMLSGAVFPIAFSNPTFDQHTTAPWVQTNVSLTGNVNASFNYPAEGPGYSFYVYVDANVSTAGMLNYQAGFDFDPASLVVDNVTGNFPGSLIYSVPGGTVLEFAGTIDNILGEVTAYGYSVDAAHAPSGYGHILKIGMHINPALSPPYTGTFPGTPVDMVIFDLNPISPKALALTDKLGNDITPGANRVNNGYMTLTVTPHGPTAALTVTPPTVVITNPQVFSGAGSTPGWNGYANVPIDHYYFDFGDGSPEIDNGAVSSVSYTYAAIGTYTARLIVHAGTTGNSTAVYATAKVVATPTFLPVVTANVTSVDLAYPAYAPGYVFTEYVDAVNITSANPLFAYQVGFTFDPSALQIQSINYGAFLTSNGGTTIDFPGSWDNTLGIVTAYGQALTDPLTAVTGSGHLLIVQFKINPALWPPYSGSFPGTFVSMMHFSADPGPTQLVLIDSSDVDFTPAPDHIFDGFFRLWLAPSPPVAIFGIAPDPVVLGTAQTFHAEASLPGWNGYAYVPISKYIWDFGNGHTLVTINPVTIYIYPATGTYTVTLMVNDTDSMMSAPAIRYAHVTARPLGCFLDLTTQNWRYIDPITLTDVAYGAGAGTGAELFRPGDLVQLFASATYNGDEVAGQLIGFQVKDRFGNTILAGTGVTDDFGIATYTFRIPWPMPDVTIEFGAWQAVATWQVGSNTPGPPYEVTQQDVIGFLVGWGLWIVDGDLYGYAPGPIHYQYDKLVYNVVNMKINVRNDYLVPVPALATANIYDDLKVPIYGPQYVTQYFLTGTTEVSFNLPIAEWAFVGANCKAKANLFTTWPWQMGTPYCPEFSKPFTILLS